MTNNTIQPVRGLIAVLDALGAATYSRDEAARFLQSRELVIEASRDKAGRNLKAFEPQLLKRFTFNDTVVLAYLADSLADVETFCHVLRVFQVLSMRNEILFRGSLAAGEFYEVDEKKNTIMGPAVSDAAAWYERAEWVGINTTPHATIFIQSLLHLEKKLDRIDHVLVDYDVPLRDKTKLKLKAVNWPKGFYIVGLSPERWSRKTDVLKLLSKHRVPLGSESKYFNTIDFFDHVEKVQVLESQFGPKPSPSAEPPDDGLEMTAPTGRT